MSSNVNVTAPRTGSPVEIHRGGGGKRFQDLFPGGLMTLGFIPTLKQPFKRLGLTTSHSSSHMRAALAGRW